MNYILIGQNRGNEGCHSCIGFCALISLRSREAVVVVMLTTYILFSTVIFIPTRTLPTTYPDQENTESQNHLRRDMLTNNTFPDNPDKETLVRLLSNGLTLSYYSSPKEGDLVISNGNWTMNRLQQHYPDAIEIIDSKDPKQTFLVKKSIVVGDEARLNISGSKVLLQSFSHKDNLPSIIITYGRTDIANSTIVSWNPSEKRPDPNPYHPRSFLVAKDGGIMNVYSSTIRYLGFSHAGTATIESALAALNYYNTGKFVISNSALDHNFYGFYSNQASDFKIVKNEIYDQVGYGLDPHTGSRDFIIDSNHIYANGRQGIICSYKCLNATITNNIVEYNAEGIGLHWLTDSSLIKNNTVKYNGEYGIFLKQECSNNIIEENTVVGNGKGIGILEGSSDNIIRANVLVGNILSEEQIYDDGSGSGNTIEDNEVSINRNTYDWKDFTPQ